MQNNNKLSIKKTKYQNSNVIFKLNQIKTNSSINPSKITNNSIIKLTNIFNLHILNTAPRLFCRVPIRYIPKTTKNKIDSSQLLKNLVLFKTGWKMRHPGYKN
jgi:hypothetical protein